MFIVNSENGFHQQNPTLALRGDGALVVAWNTNGRVIEQKVIDDFSSDVRPVDNFSDDRVDTSNGQKNAGPAVAAVGDGHVVVWNGFNATTGEWDIYGQRYDASGEKIGAEFVLAIGGNQHHEAVAGFSNGTFVVVWQGPGASGHGIYAQRYDANGTPQGSPLLISGTTGNDFDANVTALAGGKFAVSWTKIDADNVAPHTAYDVKLRIYNADGTPATGELTANQTAANYQYTQGSIAENITTLANGNIVVSWFSDQGHYDGSNTYYDVFVRVFEPDGDPVTNEIKLGGFNYQEMISVTSLTGGGFVATYRGDGPDGHGIYVQQFSANGSLTGSPIFVNTWGYGNNGHHSKVEGLADGGYAVVWMDHGIDGDNSWSIAGQRFAADGSKVGSMFIVNSENGFHQQNPTLALRGDGALVVAWNTNGRVIEQKVIGDFNGSAAPKLLLGLDGNDVLTGGSASDRLNGLAGDDYLTGKAGSDIFVFTKPGDGVDVVTDFVVGEDKLELSASHFGLDNGETFDFLFGANPHSSGTASTLLFDTTTGGLWWDADGTGSAEAVLIGLIKNGAAIANLTAADIIVAYP
jgi:Ca2+-binding RTX toxin-like protein